MPRSTDGRGTARTIQRGADEDDRRVAPGKAPAGSTARSRLGDAYRFEDLEVERVEAGDVTITVVIPETPYRMKRDAVRLRDRDDAERLARAFGFDDGEGR